MRKPRAKHLSILVAWAAVAGVLGWLGTHPQLLAPYASGLVSKHLLRLQGGGLMVRDFRLRAFEGLDLYGVSLNLVQPGGGLVLVSADTVEVDFSLRGALSGAPHLRRTEVIRPRIYLRNSAETAGLDGPRGAARGPVLPAVTIDDLVIKEAFLEVSDADGRMLERIPWLAWRGSVRTGPRTELTLRGCGLDWETHSSVLTELRGEVILDDLGIATDGLVGLLNGKRVSVSGRRGWDESLDIRVRGEGVSAAEVQELTDQTLGFTAVGDLEATFVTLGDSLLYDGTFSGELEGYRMTGLRGRAVISKDEVVLEGLSGDVNGATFTGGGRFDVRDPLSIAFVLQGEAAGVDLSRGLIPGEEDLPATDGWGQLRIEHTDAPQWTRVTGTVRDGFIDAVPFDSCRVDVEVTPQEVRFNRVALGNGLLNAVMSGRADSDRIFTGTLSFTADDLSELPEHWNWPPLSGRARGQGRLEGPLDDLAFTGRVTAMNAAMGTLSVDSCAAVLALQDILGEPRSRVELRGQGLRLGRVPLGSFAARGSVLGAVARVDTFGAALGDTQVSFAFVATQEGPVREFSVTRFRVDLEGTPWQIVRPVAFSLAPGRFSLPTMELTSAQGALAMSAQYRRGEVISGSLDLDRFDLGLLNPFLPPRAAVSGRITAEISVHGRPDQPVVDLTGDLVDAPFALVRVDSLHVEGGFSGGTATIRNLDLRSEYGRITGAGTVAHPGAGVRDFWPGASLDLDLQIEQADWAFLDQFKLPALDRLAGTFGGDLHAGGRTDDPVLEGALRSAPFHIHWLHLDELTGRVTANSRQLVLHDLAGNQDQLTLTGRIEVPLVLDLLSEPVTPPQGPFLMQLTVPEGSDLEPLSRATNAFVSTSGRGQGDILVQGPLDHPLYSGEVRIDGAGFVLRNLEEVYADASCRGRFQGDELLVTGITGREGLRGRFAGDGKVVFRGLVLETFALDLALDRFLVASIPDLAVIVSGRRAILTGVKVGPDSLLVPKFSGSLEVKKAQYTGDFSEKPGAVDPMEATVAPDWLADLHLHAEPRVGHIMNREMELDLGGDLNLVRDEAGLYLRGSLDINKGRLIVFNNNFDVVRGRLDFSQDVGFDPRVDIEAQTKYRLRSQYSSNTVVENIGVQITGSLYKPVIDFTSERGYSREAIQRMLLGLEPEATPEGDTGRLTNTSITAGFNLLEREIAQELDLFDTFEIDQIQRERETGATGLDPLIGVGKYIGSDLYFKYAQGIRQDDRDFLVEYQINAHLLLQSEIRRRIDENQGESTYNLDLKYRFEY